MARLIYDGSESFSNQVTDFNSTFIGVDGASAVGTQLYIDVAVPSAVVCASATDITNGSDLFTKAHDFTTGLKVQVTTSSALPSGLSLATDYYVIVISAGASFKVASSYANAIAGTPVDITTNGTGNQTFTPVAISATYAVQVSANDASLAAGRWANIATATAITADTTVMPVTAANQLGLLGYKYMRYAFTITAGRLNVSAYTHAHSDV